MAVIDLELLQNNPVVDFANHHSVISRIFLGIVALVGFLVIQERWSEFSYRRQAKKHGCALPPYESGYLGFKNTGRLIIAMRKFRLVESIAETLFNFNLKTGRMRSPLSTSIVTIEPENIKAVLATQFKDFDLGNRYDQFKPMLGDGIFTLSGNGWHHSRSLLRPQFSNEQVSRLHDIEEHVKILLKLFERDSREKGFFDCQEYFFQLTLDTATEFLFGESTDTLSGSLGVMNDKMKASLEFQDAFNKGQIWLLVRSIAMSLSRFVTGPGFIKSIRVCQNFVSGYVKQAIERAEERDVDEKKRLAFEEPERYVFLDELTRETRDPVLMRDQALNILLAGRDTTAGTLSFSVAQLVRNPHIYAKLREQVLADFGEGTENITFQSLKRCEYLKNFINEVLRVYPIVPLNFRTANKDTTLPRGGGPNGDEPIFVPKGTDIQYVTYALHHDKSIWGEDTETFDPDRWVNLKVPNWAYIPFNGGPRICLGQQFALTEVGYTLARIAQTFKRIDINPADDGKHILQIASLTAAVHEGVSAKFVS